MPISEGLFVKHRAKYVGLLKLELKYLISWQYIAESRGRVATLQNKEISLTFPDQFSLTLSTNVFTEIIRSTSHVFLVSCWDVQYVFNNGSLYQPRYKLPDFKQELRIYLIQCKTPDLEKISIFPDFSLIVTAL